jgi:hypothetical protein
MRAENTSIQTGWVNSLTLGDDTCTLGKDLKSGLYLSRRRLDFSLFWFPLNWSYDPCLPNEVWDYSSANENFLDPAFWVG